MAISWLSRKRQRRSSWSMICTLRAIASLPSAANWKREASHRPQEKRVGAPARLTRCSAMKNTGETPPQPHLWQATKQKHAAKQVYVLQTSHRDNRWRAIRSSCRRKEAPQQYRVRRDWRTSEKYKVHCENHKINNEDGGEWNISRRYRHEFIYS